MDIIVLQPQKFNGERCKNPIWETLKNLIERLRYFCRKWGDAALDILNNLYHEYEQLLIGKRKRLSTVYFSKATSKEAPRKYTLALTRYLIEDILKLDEESAKLVLTTEILEQFHLLTYIDKYVNIRSMIPREERINFIVNSCYHDNLQDLRKYTIGTYEKLLHNEVSMPKSFFKGGQGRINATVCLQDAIEELQVDERFRNYLGKDVETLYYFFANACGKKNSMLLNSFLKETKLAEPCRLFYSNEPLEFLHVSLCSTQKNPYLYHFLRFQRAYKEFLEQEKAKEVESC
jgi:hypothetical protein